MAVSIAQYVDLLFKKLQGVAKTANSTVKSASNESIASPAFLRGDIVWVESNQIGNTAQAITGISTAYRNSGAVECVADSTVPPISGIRPTWLTNKTYWIPQEFGSTWLPKVFVGPTSAANIEATGTQIFSAGIGGVGEYYFDTQAGVLNFIGETIPTVLTSGNVVYVAGYQYSGLLGTSTLPGNTTIGNILIANTTITTNQVAGNLILDPQGNINVANNYINNLANPVLNTDAATKSYVDAGIGNVQLGNFTFSNTTISTSVSPGNITLSPTGNSTVIINTNSGLVVATGTELQRPGSATVGTLRFNTDTGFLEVYDGAGWDSIDTNFAITSQTIVPSGSTSTFTLNESTTAESIILTINGIAQIPITNYTVTGDQLTMAEMPLATDIIEVRYISPAPASGTIASGTAGRLGFYASSGTTISQTNGNLTWNGTDQLTVAGNVVVSGAFLKVPAYANTTVRDAAITTPDTGIIVITNGIFQGYNGTAWVTLG
jgi:hypothetical protein